MNVNMNTKAVVTSSGAVSRVIYFAVALAGQINLTNNFKSRNDRNIYW